MDLATVGAMVLGEGHSPATMQIVMPPVDPRATESPHWTLDVKSQADVAFQAYQAETAAPPSKPDPNLAQTLLVVATGVAALQHLVHEGRPAVKLEEEDEDEQEKKSRKE